MKLKIVADENVHYGIIDKLRSEGYEDLSIMEDYSGISDKEVLEICTEKEAILLPEDSDFGEWIFSYQKDNCGVIFLRYKFKDLENTITKIKTILEKYGTKLYNKFTVITPGKVRIRDI